MTAGATAGPWSLRGEDATLAFGASAARALPTGAATPFVVLLEGDLGAGKTTFARGLLRELGITRPVRSPSYGLLELYDAGRWQVLHLDLYRLHDPEELENLGLRDHHAGRTLWLVEWPERGTGHLPPADLRLTFLPGAGVHRVEAAACTPAGLDWLGRLNPEANL
ncbi:MAG: hypothetical protein RLZZ200_2870 [Pseudomonadota bacterium]|jgi:tRNA threonylcarbamoyladenosine biosynthesis protein TsaE